jgi:hypothetical protein
MFQKGMRIGQMLGLRHEDVSEEEAQIPQLEERGYIRMCEKCEQLVASLRPLIAVLEQMKLEVRA